ncbi:Transmembrane protein [Trema orientale]|uniref:Transmembrane protein n=1 Tax=Trema orientale TaxID=63057 RepID=A0A2P5BQF6_TREOI|nr:Transmembrane protein [Trema orientale]
MARTSLLRFILVTLLVIFAMIFSPMSTSVEARPPAPAIDCPDCVCCEPPPSPGTCCRCGNC